MSQKLTVIAKARAKKGKEDELRKGLMALLPPTRKEEGCLNYDLHESLGTPGLFYFHENWASQEALDKHLASAHIRSVMSRAAELLAEPVDIQVVKLI